MAKKPNYDFEKRKRELEKKRKKEEKQQRRREQGDNPGSDVLDAPIDGAPAGES